MHNLEKLTSSQDIDGYTEALWATDTFKRSHKEKGGYIRGHVDRFMEAPRIFYRMDDNSIERTHFTAWMNAIAHRTYPNPTIQDLYYLHEIVHAGTMVWDPNRDFESFIRGLWINEQDASLESEVFTYFGLPDLRPQSFGFEIWADRYLDNRVILAEGESNRELYKNNNPEFVRQFARERVRAMFQPKPGDDIETMIHWYGSLNEDWARIWKNNWREVEVNLHKFQELAKVSRKDAVDQLASWLIQTKGNDVCPFEKEAREFAEAFLRK